MSKKTMTRRALFTSVISLILCCAMLMGTTFAWFTDSVTSGNNHIQAGNLDVELYYGKDTNPDDKVDNATTLFTTIDGETAIVWEPGAVAYTNLKVANVGTLALKYQMGLNFSNMNYVEYDGIRHDLSEVLKVAVVNGGFDGEREDATGLNYSYSLSNFELSGVLEGNQKSETYGIVLYWEPGIDEYDNLFNLKNGKTSSDGDALHVDLGINLFATQEMYEEDSFGDDYDENASYSVWDGVVPAEMPETLVVDGTTQTVHVKDAAAFAYLSTLSAKWADLYTDGNGRTYTNYANGAGANYYYSGQWTVNLEANIDLNNKDIAPISIMFGEATGATAFNGNGHIIRNIKTTTGLFATRTRASFSDLVLVNVRATNGALTDFSDAPIVNVTVKNATISGENYVGGLVGKAYSDVKNCKVMNSSVVASGKEAGGLIGYAEANSKGSEISNNTVYNVSVRAGNRAAGLVAQPNVNIKVYNNTIDTVTVSAENTSEYAPGAVVSNAQDATNVYNNTVKNVNVVDGNSQLDPDSGLIWNGDSANHKSEYYIYSADDLEKAFDYFTHGEENASEADVSTIKLMADIDMAGRIWEPKNVMWVTIDGNGKTISNLTSATGWRSGFLGYAGATTINNLTLHNVTSTGAQAGTFAGSAEGLQINNSKLTGTNTVTYTEYVSDSYTETYGGIGAITGVVQSSNINVTIDSGATVVLNKVSLNTECSYIDTLTGYLNANNGSVINNGTVKEVFTVANVTELQNALDLASNGAEIRFSADITGDVTATQKPDVKITIDGDGHKFGGVLVVDGKSGTYTTAGLTIKNVNFVADSITADACINLGADGDNNTRYTCNVTVDNCTFDVPGAVGVKSYTGGDKNLTITGCTATANAHSLVQAKGIDGILVENCKVYSKNGMNFNNSDNVTVSGCTADVKGYAVRFGESSGGVGAAETYAIKNSTLKSECNDGDAVIVLRGTADYATLTITETTIEGTIEINNTATGATVVR